MTGMAKELREWNMITEQEMRKQYNKTANLSVKFHQENTKLMEMMTQYYGEENYNDHDMDNIIDTLDYGNGKTSFKEFDKIMKEINNQPEED
jgi:hypothetical protein